jgi:hypothetical protein
MPCFPTVQLRVKDVRSSGFHWKSRLACGGIVVAAETR